MRNINYLLILKVYLRHVAVQVQHLQGEQNSSSKNSCQHSAVIFKALQAVVVCSLLFYLVCANVLIDLSYRSY